MVTATTATSPINSPRDSVSRRSRKLMAPTLGTDPGSFRDGRHPRRRVAPGRETCLHPAMRRTREAGIGLDELAQAARNHGMPLEALRADVTPPGMHYVLVHYDVPFVDAAAHTIAFEGFDRPLELALDDLRARPAVTMPITFECAGNGRALFETRAVSQPWLLEAVGTGEWTGTPLAPLLREAGVPLGHGGGAVHGPRPGHRGRAGTGVRARPAAR